MITPYSSDLKSDLREAFLQAGAVAVGFAQAAPVSAEMKGRYECWLSEGRNAGMNYMRNHLELRADPRLLLPETATVIVTAFSFAPDPSDDPAPGRIASYAYGLDYHDVLRTRLNNAIQTLSGRVSAQWRICIDSAPLPERYWAVKAGVGYTGRNGAIIVPGHGGMVFLALILTTLPVEADEPLGLRCAGCNLCRQSCPGHAIAEDGTVDARRCLSYLTIEHRGDWTDPVALDVMATEAGRRCLFGCDICLRVCPHNQGAVPTAIEEFRPLPAIPLLTPERILSMDQTEFSSLLKGSPIKRAKLPGLRRNALNTLNSDLSEVL